MKDKYTGKEYTKKDYTRITRGTPVRDFFLKVALVCWFCICCPVEVFREKTGWNIFPSVRWK